MDLHPAFPNLSERMHHYWERAIRIATRFAIAFSLATMMGIAVGFAVSFIVALAVIRLFVAYVSKSGFAPFAWYRIVAGALAVFLLSR